MVVHREIIANTRRGIERGVLTRRVFFVQVHSPGKHLNLFKRVDSQPKSAADVHLVKGRQGRVSGNRAHKVTHTFTYNLEDNGHIPEFKRDRARVILSQARLAQLDGGHDLSTEKTVTAVIIDAMYIPTRVTIPLTAATGKTASGYYLSNKDAIENAIFAAYPDLQEIDTKAVTLYFTTFRGVDVLFGFPLEAVDPALFFLLDLARFGDSVHDTMAVELSMKDTTYCGRSRPHISETKFKFLFPGMSPPSPPVRAKKQKRPRSPSPSPENDENARPNTNTAVRTGSNKNNMALTEDILKILAQGTMTLCESERVKIVYMSHFLDLVRHSPKCEYLLKHFTSFRPETCFEAFTKGDFLRSLAKSCGVFQETECLIMLIESV